MSRLLPVVAVAVCLVVVTALPGCATLPGSSAPRVLDSYAPKVPGETGVSPQPGSAAADIVQGFLQTGAQVGQRHGAARQYLTPEAAESWDDAVGTTIVLRAEIVPLGASGPDRATFAIRGDRVGTLTAGGIYEDRDGTLDVRVELLRVDGEWRISGVPGGVILERSAFFSSFARRDLHFLNRTGTAVVPDPRWTAAYQSDLESALINLLAEGPRPGLAEGVRTVVPPTVSVRPPEKSDGRPGTTIDFRGLRALGSTELQQFVAQVVWTLDQAKVPGPYRIEREGTPVDERRSGGWTIADVASFWQRDPRPALGYALTAADGLVRVGEAGASPAGGAWSSLRNGRSASLSRDGSLIAAVVDPDQPESGAESELVVGGLAGAPRSVLRADTLTTPTWDRTDGSVWTVLDGVRPVRISSPGERPRVEEVGTSLRALGGEVTTFALDDTGTRVVVVAGRKAYVGTIVATSRGEVSVTALKRVAQNLGETITSAAWQDRGGIVLGRDVAEAPVVALSVYGALAEPLSKRNITSPVGAVVVIASRVYALDGRSLLTLDTGVDIGSRFWQDLPGLTSIRAYPVASG